MTRIASGAPLAVLTLGSALLLSACNTQAPSASSQTGGGQKVTYLDKTSIPKDKAQMVFEQTCMNCHANGVGPVITGRELPVDAVKMFVRNGNRAMPAFTEAMIDNETLDRVAELVSKSKAPAAGAIPYPYAPE
jgi:mono/diheme cytochrome c family protein